MKRYSKSASRRGACFSLTHIDAALSRAVLVIDEAQETPPSVLFEAKPAPDVQEDLMRVSVGLEDAYDLIQDLGRGLSKSQSQLREQPLT